jgi:hypothetical protein
MRFLFIEFPTVLRKNEYETSHGLLSGYIYEMIKERILDINSQFRKWRKESNNENNIRLNVRNSFFLFNSFFI